MLKITEKRHSEQKAENSLVFPRHHRFIFQLEGELALSCGQHLVSRLVNINDRLSPTIASTMVRDDISVRIVEDRCNQDSRSFHFVGRLMASSLQPTLLSHFAGEPSFPSSHMHFLASNNPPDKFRA